MSQDRQHLPRTAGMAEHFGKHGKAPRMRDTAVRDASGKIDWEATSRDFPMMPEMQRQLRAEKEARGERD